MQRRGPVCRVKISTEQNGYNSRCPFDTRRPLPTKLSARARDYIRQSLRPNTRRAYAAQLKLWLAWCAQQGISPFPAAPEVVASYLAERGAAGHSVSTLRTVVAAIKAGHDANGLP